MFRHILVATDGSRLSEKAVDASLRLAKDLGAKVTAFHATQDYPVSPFSDYAMVSGSLTPATWKADEEKRARRILDKFEAKAKKAGVPCKTAFAMAVHPYDAILKAAKKAGCDAIVMASHGRRGIQGVLLGSETSKVLTHGKLPVLVYR